MFLRKSISSVREPTQPPQTGPNEHLDFVTTRRRAGIFFFEVPCVRMMFGRASFLPENVPSAKDATLGKRPLVSKIIFSVRAQTQPLQTGPSENLNFVSTRFRGDIYLLEVSCFRAILGCAFFFAQKRGKRRRATRPNLK